MVFVGAEIFGACLAVVKFVSVPKESKPLVIVFDFLAHQIN